MRERGRKGLEKEREIAGGGHTGSSIGNYVCNHVHVCSVFLLILQVWVTHRHTLTPCFLPVNLSLTPS